MLVFLGAFLLFEIEPLAGKIITPLLGGTSSVWIVCLLFFQIVVLGGYLLTYLLARLAGRTQVIVYILLFALSLLWASPPPAAAWILDYKSDPTWVLLAALTAHLSIPCIVLSSISGTMQVWQAATGSSNPYRLYSLSNLGSFSALLMYPTLLEPQLSVSETLRIWEAIYIGLFAVASIAAAFMWRFLLRSRLAQGASDAKAPTLRSGERLKIHQIWHWLYLSTLGSAALLSFSSHITTEVSPVPLLWVLPLAIYLLTFVIAFGRSKIKTDLLIQSWVPMVVAELVFQNISPAVVITINLILLFQLCMVTNIELSESKPSADRLAAFYLVLAIGGALGGVLVAIVAPLCLNFAGERAVVILLFTIHHLFTGQNTVSRGRLILRVMIASLMSIALLMWLIFPTHDIVHRERNFFGSVSVKREGDMLALYHGRVKHGLQYLDPKKAEIDVYPYGPPAALVFSFLHNYPRARSINVAVIGLGAGSMAAEVRAGDRIDFYEIDPKMQTTAEHWFSYLAHSRAKVGVQIGDGRLLLNNSKQQFDAICIDAFSGDAVPVHLLTVEAMQIYLNHLERDGLLFFHITNAYLDLAPIIGNVATVLHLDGCELLFNQNVRYVVVCRDPAKIRALVEYATAEGKNFSGTSVLELPKRPELKVWTDNYSNLFNILKWRS